MRTSCSNLFSHFVAHLIFAAFVCIARHVYFAPALGSNTCLMQICQFIFQFKTMAMSTVTIAALMIGDGFAPKRSNCARLFPQMPTRVQHALHRTFDCHLIGLLSLYKHVVVNFRKYYFRTQEARLSRVIYVFIINKIAVGHGRRQSWVKISILLRLCFEIKFSSLVEFE